MNASTDGQFLIPQQCLDTDGAPDRIHGAAKHHHQAVAQLLDDFAIERSYDREYDFPLLLEQLHGAQLIFLHLTGIANDIRENDGRQPVITVWHGLIMDED
jgi:hypothetical protein